MSVELTAAWWGSEEGVEGKGVDVLAQVKTLHASGEASVPIGNEVMGSDPLEGVVKTLFVTYTVDGAVKKLTVVEHEPLVFANLV